MNFTENGFTGLFLFLFLFTGFFFARNFSRPFYACAPHSSIVVFPVASRMAGLKPVGFPRLAGEPPPFA